MLKQLFSAIFLFEINRVQIQPVDQFFLFCGLVALVFAVIFKLSAKYSPSPVDTKYRNRFFNVFLFIGISEIIWYGARVQLVKFFGTHFVALLILLLALFWIFKIIWDMFKNYRNEKNVWEKEQVRLKYLPK